MMLWQMGPRQSLSQVFGTHVVLDCKWIITVFYTQYRSPPTPHPPTQSMLFKPKHIKPDEKWDTTLNRGRVGGIDVFLNSNVLLWHLSQDYRS